MIYKTFLHTLPTGENAKFTNSQRTINGQTYYYANVVNTDLKFYVALSEFEKNSYLGVEVSNDSGATIFYSNAQQLETDLTNYYGIRWLESEF